MYRMCMWLIKFQGCMFVREKICVSHTVYRNVPHDLILRPLLYMKLLKLLQHRLRRWNHSAAVGGILDSGRLATIFAWLELAWLLCLQTFASKSPGYALHQSGHPMTVHCCGMGKASGDTEYIHKTCRSFRHWLEARVAKNGAFLK